MKAARKYKIIVPTKKVSKKFCSKNKKKNRIKNIFHHQQQQQQQIDKICAVFLCAKLFRNETFPKTFSCFSSFRNDIIIFSVKSIEKLSCNFLIEKKFLCLLYLCCVYRKYF